MKRILILGGGIGGLVAANELRRALPREHRVTLVDRESSHLFAPSLVWLVLGERTAERISRPLARLERKGIEVLRGEVSRIDAERREAAVDGKTIAADYLVIALGADYDPGAIPGLSEAGHNFYTLEGAERLRDAVAGFRGGRLVVLNTGLGHKCPPAPYETAMLLEYFYRKRRLRDRVDLSLYAPEPGPMAMAGPEIAKGIRNLVEAKRIAYHPSHQVVSIDPEKRRIRFENEIEADYDLLAYIPPHRAPRVVRESGLTGPGGWIAVDRHTLATRYPGVYAVGDVVSIPLTAGKPLPRAGVFAHGQAHVVSKNIASEIKGRERPATFDGTGTCFVEVGDGKAAMGSGDFYAEPMPRIVLKPPGGIWHMAKVLLEKDWLRRWF
jgi:sulfide:quinone oxidoreductase